MPESGKVWLPADEERRPAYMTDDEPLFRLRFDRLFSRLLGTRAPRSPLLAPVNATLSMPQQALAGAKEDADEEPGEEQLDRRRDASAAVPTAQPVAGKVLASARPQEANNMFEVRG